MRFRIEHGQPPRASSDWGFHKFSTCRSASRPEVVHRRLHKCGHAVEGYRPCCGQRSVAVGVSCQPAVMAIQHPPPTAHARTNARGSSPTPPRLLNAATVVLWRAPGVVQLELGPRRVVVDNVGPDEMTALLSGPVGRSDTFATPELADALDVAGFLSTPIRAEETAAATAPPPARLRAERGALSGRFGDDAAAVLQSRRQAAVAVHGTSRLTASVAATLASAGVGRVRLVHGGEVNASDACPGGLSPADEGRRFGAAAGEAVRRSAPEVDTSPGDQPPDLVILTDPAPVESAVLASLHLDALAHLSATVDGSHAVIGPLVLPGTSSCLRCAELHRRDRDPAWPALAVQLASRPSRRAISEVSLCVATVGVAVAQALSYLDRERPATLDATLEWQLPDWRLRRRSWPVHHGCDCGATTVRTRHGRMGS